VALSFLQERKIGAGWHGLCTAYSGWSRDRSIPHTAVRRHERQECRIADAIQIQPGQYTRYQMENSAITNEPGTYEEMTQVRTWPGYCPDGVSETAPPPVPEAQFANTRPIGVLIVDDNRLNGASVRRSFGALQVSMPMFEVRTCGEAWDVLHGTHSRIDVLPPCVLLLNLDMPQSFDFLQALRGDANLAVRNATVFVHSKSNSVAHRNRAYNWNIAGYIHDRPGRKSLLRLARLLREYIWAVELPDHGGMVDRSNMAPHRRWVGAIEMPSLNVAPARSSHYTGVGGGGWI
jgi:hypothetical protein